MSNMARIFLSEMKGLFRNIICCIITIGLIVMPSIFAWYNIIACWDVFENTGDLKVAVANSDEGYESDLFPLRVNVGDQVVSALRANDQIGWVVTDEEDAIDGAKSGRYYAAVVIPQSFSKDMLTFYTSESEQASIIYYVNEKKNAIAPKITDQGADTISYQVNEVFAETLSEVALVLAQSLNSYIENNDVGGHVSELASHVGTVADSLDRAAQILDLYGELSQASQELLDTAVTLGSQAGSQAQTLLELMDSNSSTLEGAASHVTEGLDGISAAFSKSDEALASLDESLDGLFATAVAGNAQAVEALRASAQGLDNQAQAATTLADALAGAESVVPPESLDAYRQVITSLRTLAERLQSAAQDMNQAADRAESGSGSLDEQKQALHDSIAQARADLAQSAAQYNDSVRPEVEELVADATRLATSLRASDGTAVVGKAEGALNQAQQALSGASGASAHATESLSEASAKLRDAATKLRTMEQDLQTALATGDASALKDLLSADAEVYAKAMAAPVGLERITVFPAANFGSAMAPLYTTLALFIGSLLILVTLKPRSSDAVVSKLTDPKPRQLFLGHFGVMAFISFCQTTLMALGNMLFLQVQVVHPWLFMLIFWTAGLVFTFLIYALVAAFANLGKAIAVILLIVQVTGCGGSYPLQILPSFVQALSPLLPATYVVNAMRAAMFGTYQNDFWIQWAGLLVFLIPAALIGLVLRKPLAKFMNWYVEKVESSSMIS